MTVLKIIFFLLKKKILTAFKGKDSIIKIFFILLLLSVTILYAWFYSQFISLIENNIISINEINYINILQIIIIFIAIIKNFFPRYLPLPKISHKLYPLKNYERFLINILYDFLNFTNLCIILFISLVFLESEYFKLNDFFSCFIILAIANFVRRNIQIQLENEIKNKWLYFIISLIFYLPIISPLYYHATNFVLIIFLIAFIVFQFFIEKFIKTKHIKRQKKIYIELNPYLKLLFNNKIVKNLLIYNLIFKFISLLAFFIVFEITNKTILDLEKSQSISLLLFISPALIFSHIYNNIWGFYPNLWLNLKLTNSFNNIVKFQFGLLKYPIIIDFVITLSFLIACKLFTSLILFYLFSTIGLISLSILMSFIRAKNISQNLIFKPQTSSLSIILSIVIVFVCSTPVFINSSFYVYIIPILILLFTYYYLLNKQNKINKKLYRTFFS